MPYFDTIPTDFNPRQKFFRGDVVRISENLPKDFRHLRGAGQRAVVVGSWVDIHGGVHGDEPVYILLIEDAGLYPGTPVVTGNFPQSFLTKLARHDGERILQYYNENRYRTNR